MSYTKAHRQRLQHVDLDTRVEQRKEVSVIDHLTIQEIILFITQQAQDYAREKLFTNTEKPKVHVIYHCWAKEGKSLEQPVFEITLYIPFKAFKSHLSAEKYDPRHALDKFKSEVDKFAADLKGLISGSGIEDK